MIHEYALEPELVATWYQRELFRHFIERFGFREEDGSATGRVVGKYPNNKWIRQVWEMFNKNFGQSAREDDRERVRELLKQLTILQVRRSRINWDGQCTWLENAEEENRHRPFHAILALENPRNNPQVVCGENVLPDSMMDPPSLWRVPLESPVSRTAASMAEVLKPMLRCATHILFVDPHFSPSKPRFRNPLREFLSIICDDSRKVVEYHVKACYENAPSSSHFFLECEQRLPRLIPRGVTLTVHRWKERDGGEKLHNRYILTDIGGVSFGTGLDEGDGTDDIQLLSRKVWHQRLVDYDYSYFGESEPAFDLERKESIRGTL